MATLAEWMERQRLAREKGEGMAVGPPVLIVAGGNKEVVIAKPNEPRRPRIWSTQVINLEQEDQEYLQERVRHLAVLQALVGDESPVIELVRSAQHPSQDICLGRAKLNDIVLEDTTISSIHATIEDTGATLMLVDRNSSNGSFVNRVKLTPNVPQPITSGDCIRLGRCIFYFLSRSRLIDLLKARWEQQQNPSAQ
jgi:hypothetical protein